MHNRGKLYALLESSRPGAGHMEPPEPSGGQKRGFVMILKKVNNDLKPEDTINISDSQKSQDKIIVFNSDLLSLEKLFFNLDRLDLY